MDAKPTVFAYAEGDAPEDVSEFKDPNVGAQKLSGISIFKGFRDQELRQIYSRGEIQRIKPKSYAVIEGDPSRGLFVILKGEMSVYKNDAATGSMHRIAYLREGNSFGELTLFDQAPRSASVSAESSCRLFYLDASVFSSVLDQLGNDAKMRFYKSCAEELVVRFRQLNNDYISSQKMLWRFAFAEPEQKNKTISAQGGTEVKGQESPHLTLAQKHTNVA